MKGKAVIHFIVAGASFGMGLWNCRQEEIWAAFIGSLWFASAGFNIYCIIEA